MSARKDIDFKLLNLDLDNFRTTHQKNELTAINTMITLKQDKFWALMESIIDDGFHPTENLIILEHNGKFIVKEGNRRVASLKLIHGKIKGIDLPSNLVEKISALPDSWKASNTTVPCSIYQYSEIDYIDKLVSLVHGKGEKASRDQWGPVAKARYNRDKKSISEPGLDLLEKYLQYSKNASENQKELWSGDFPLTILDEVIRTIYSQLNCESKTDLVSKYPKKNKTTIDKIMYDIGIGNLSFNIIRDTQVFFGTKYGVQNKRLESSATESTIGNSPTTSAKKIALIKKQNTKAIASNDPRSVALKLKMFTPMGRGRDKLVTLLIEIRKLKIQDHPHAFCFLLRSMFEISAKAYCTDNKSNGGPTVTNSGGNKSLADILSEIVKYMTKDMRDQEKVKLLHGSITEVTKKNGLLSVTSLNQLIHNPSFSIQPNDICILFGNIFPLLEEMNK